MIFKTKLYFKKIPMICVALISIFTITACSDDDSDESSVGKIQLYNVASNSPSIFLTVGKDDDDDVSDLTHSGVAYPSTGGQFDYAIDSYDIDLSWQDEDDITDLEIVFESSLDISSDEIKFIVFAEDINSPNILTYDIPIVDDEDDVDDELFNVRILNLHTLAEGIDIYISESDETFLEATLLGNFNYTEMSDNQKILQDDYVFYITTGGSSDVVFRSDEISFSSTAQFIMAIRENKGSGESPFILDKVSNTISEYPDYDAVSQFRIYNGIALHEQLPDYTENFNFHLNGLDDSPEISMLEIGSYSDFILTDFGDYSISLTIPDNDEYLIENHLLTLQSNSDKTIFFYLEEVAVDDDNDGDVDEDGDGIVDAYEITTKSLVVENSQNQSIYDHQVNIINLIDDFSNVNVYFVLSDETTQTASNQRTAIYANPQSITLRNNSYTVYVIANDGSSELILATTSLTLDEESNELYLILQEDPEESSGYTMSFSNQKVSELF
jgi:hypothetical protein